MTIKQHTNRLKSKVTLRKIINKIKWKAKKKWDIIRFNREHHLILSSLITSQEIKNEDIILYTPTIDWNISLFQRPQHLALQFSKFGYLFFFATPNYQDRVNGFKKISDNLYITNRYDILLKNLPSNLNKWILINSTNRNITYKTIRKYKTSGFKIIYDYIDEITPIISPVKISLDRHKKLTNDDVDLVIATADTLYKEMVQRFPSEKVLYIPNGVDYTHFKKTRTNAEYPSDLKNIILEKKPIIGYYGAFAKWIDYRLIEYIAEERKNWNIVLIGPDYDGSIISMAKKNNIIYLGQKKYDDLPNYAVWFDVAIIPFSNGQIARSTSPLKLFEYMAMNKPVVVTKDLIECYKYKGVLVGEDYKSFLLKIEEGLQLKDNYEYIKVIDAEARENTWEKRVIEIDRWMKGKDEYINNIKKSVNGK